MLAAVIVSACGAAKPSGSADRAGLAFTRYTPAGDSSVWVADADGSNARLIVPEGFGTDLSPDGRRLKYSLPEDIQDSGLLPLYVVDVAGGKPRRLGEAAAAAWSPDSSHLVFSDGKTSWFVDIDSGKRRPLPLGEAAGGFSFAPDGTAVAFARVDTRYGRLKKSDVFVVRLADGKTEQLTHDGHSDRPQWGRDWIAYRHFRFVNEDHWPSIGEVRLIRPDGTGEHLFARGDENSSAAHYGLEPVAFSADGERLLACNAREFSCPPVTFTVGDGKRHELSVADEPGKVAYASEFAADGNEVLVDVGPFDGPAGHRVYAVAFEGGRARLLVKDGSDPSWAQ